MTVCVVGDTTDLSAVYFTWAARRAGLEVLELDEQQLGVTWSFRCDDGAHGSVLNVAGNQTDFGQVIGAFARFKPEPGAPPGVALGPAELQALQAERRSGLYQFLNCLPCPVANRPSACRSNGSKAVHMTILEQEGFRVPDWLVSNDLDEVNSFIAGSKQAPVYKAVSGLRCRVRQVDDALFRRLAEGTTPVVIQSYIEGIDVRVHVVGDSCFPTEIKGRGVDYRFDGTDLYREIEMPEAIARRCCDVAAKQGLLLAGFDFRVTQAGQWFCLEVNPMPSFIPYQWATGQPIAETLVWRFRAHQVEFPPSDPRRRHGPMGSRNVQ